MLTSFAIRSSNAAPRYPERVSAYLPKGARAALNSAAERENITTPELVRRALTEKVLQPKKDA